MGSELPYHPTLKDTKNRYKYFTLLGENQKERFTCAICNDILIKPHQSLCGCRFCETCVNEHTEELKKKCPGCKDIFESKENNTIRDKAVEKEILELEMICLNKNCKYKCKLRSLSEHLEMCDHRVEKCVACGELYLYKEEEEHMVVYCPLSSTRCKDCGLEMTKKDLDETHRNVNGSIDKLCDNWRSVCPCGCSDEIQYNVKMHLSECPRVAVECVMKYVGCTKRLPRGDMEGHMKEDGGYHMGLMVVQLGRLKNENEEIRAASLDSERKMRLELDRLKKTIEDSSSRIKIVQGQVLSTEGKYSSLQNEANNLRQSLNLSPTSSKIVFDHSQSRVGEYTWIIPEIMTVIKSAKRGVSTQIFSEHFYSHKPGYKLSLKAYPNGDGKALGDHFSLYFVIMKGEYDDEISWPFKQKVSLSLLSNKAGQSNRTINMRPDTNENCYGKPQKEYNLAAGQPHFVSHVEMARFVQDGAISIQVRII